MTQFDPILISTEAEEKVIGTILVYPDSLNNIISRLTPEMFSNSQLQAIYKCCLEVHRKYGTVDMVTVGAEMKKGGGEDSTIRLMELTAPIVSNQMIENHALLVVELHIKRELVRLADSIKESAINDDLADIIGKAETGILNLSGKIHKKEPRSLKLIISEVLDLIEKINNDEIQLFGVPSGFAQLDRMTSGFNKGELTIIAGRPSVGKTAIAMQIAKNAAQYNFPVGIFSCEMSQLQQGLRYLSGVSGYTNTQLKRKGIDVAHVRQSAEPLQNLGIYIDDTAGISLLELRAKTRKLILRYGIRLVIIDYLQLMSGSKTKQNREQEVSEISAGLKAIAVDLEIPVIALSQLNRKSEDRKDKRPEIFDLRESGSIEQDADLILLLYRPELYMRYYNDPDDKQMDAKDLIVLDIAKHRNGAMGEIYLRHNESMTEISDYD